MVKSASEWIKATGGAKDAKPTPASQFGSVVNLSYPAWSPVYVEKCARGVMDGECDSIAPSSGTDIFCIVKIGDEIIATTRPRGNNQLNKYKLVA